jgi:hypothetical protein
MNYKNKYYKYWRKDNLFLGGNLCELPVIKTKSHQDCWIDTVIYAFLSNRQLCNFLMSQWHSILQQNTNNPLNKIVQSFESLISQLYEPTNMQKILNYNRIQFGEYLKKYIVYLSEKQKIDPSFNEYLIDTIQPLGESLNKGNYEYLLDILLKEINDNISFIKEKEIEKIKTIDDPKNCVIYSSYHYTQKSPAKLSQIEEFEHKNGNKYILVSGTIGANRKQPEDHVISFFRCETNYYLFDNKLNNLIEINKNDIFSYQNPGSVFKTPLGMSESSIYLFYMKQ